MFLFIPELEFGLLGQALGEHLQGLSLLESKRYRESYQVFLGKLRKSREQAGLTQVEAASRLGKHQSFVSKCETGERRVDFVELLALSKLYGVDFSFFIPGKDD